MSAWWPCIAGLVGFIILMVVISISGAMGNIKSGNYTEFPMNENNHPMTWKDRGDY